MRTTLATTGRLAVAVCCVAVAAGAATASAEPPPQASAQRPNGCVSKPEYHQVEVGMTRAVVHRSFETDGTRTSFTHHGGRASEVRTYDVCRSPDSTVTVSYQQGRRGPMRVTGKTAVWVE